MFNLEDIQAVQAVRPDLSEDGAAEVLGFLNDVYAVESFEVSDTAQLFKETAEDIQKRKDSITEIIKQEEIREEIFIKRDIKKEIFLILILIFLMQFHLF